MYGLVYIIRQLQTQRVVLKLKGTQDTLSLQNGTQEIPEIHSARVAIDGHDSNLEPHSRGVQFSEFQLPGRIQSILLFMLYFMSFCFESVQAELESFEEAEKKREADEEVLFFCLLWFMSFSLPS